MTIKQQYKINTMVLKIDYVVGNSKNKGYEFAIRQNITYKIIIQ